VTRRWRRVAVVASVLALTAGLGACSEEELGRRDVQAALDATRLLPHRFVYTVSTPEAGSFQVQGLVEDDFRYKARLRRGSTTVFDEVVNDDAIAVRFAEPDLLGAYIDESQRAVAELDTDLTGVTVVDALQAKRWVLDPAGAPSLTDQTRAARNQGKDPVFDALGIYAYVERAMAESFDVQEWSADDLSPAYRSSEDVFPRPAEDSGVSRYDLVRPFLPPIGATGGASDDLPAAKHFRKMAIYIKDGRIVRVMERIESTGRGGDDLVGYLRNLGEEVGYPDDVLDELERELGDLSERERSDAMLAMLSEIAASSGGTPIPSRIMTFDLVDVGAEDIEADLPLDVIEGSLAILLNRGAKVEAAAASGGPGTSPASRTEPDDAS
jgi:hypothetical protein